MSSHNGELFRFTEGDKEALVGIVKMAQKRQSRGSEGGWKEFLAAIDKKHGASKSDPAKRPWHTLAAFVYTLTAEQDIQMVKKFKHKEHQRKKIERLDAEGLWGKSPEQHLVQITRKHSRYKELYSFPSYDEGWVITKLGKEGDPSTSERMISIDCEMVICEHGEYELVRVCAVDREFQALLDLLVKPSTPVIDYLTPITGVSAEDLNDVTCSVVDAQKELLKLLTAGTILVGHSLYHDLKALKIDHARVIDTAFIFQYRNKPEGYSAGLNDLSKVVLGHSFREEGKPHDCLQDAIMPMKVVLYKLENNLTEPLDIPSRVMDENELSKLYLHNIPASVSMDDLQEVFPEQHHCEIQPISWNNNNTGKTYAIFSSISEANDAFKNLCGKIGMDSYGRLQKTVAIHKTQEFLKVRKMSPDNLDTDGLLEVKEHPSTLAGKSSSNPTNNGDATPQIAYAAVECDKLRKRIRNTNVTGCEEKVIYDEHDEELKKLKETIELKDAEIASLQRIIVGLMRKQGL